MNAITKKEAIEEIKKGNMVIMLDDEDRENEGDLVYSAALSTPELVNFMVTHAKGLVCVSVSSETTKGLNFFLWFQIIHHRMKQLLQFRLMM